MLVLVIGAWTMALGFLLRIVWGQKSMLDSVGIYAIQNLVRFRGIITANRLPSQR